MMGLGFRSLLLAGSLAVLASPASAQLYRDHTAPIPARVDDLVGRMTLDEKARQLQNGAPAIPRLGIPAYDWWNEALHGVARAGEATVFPQAIAMAATWDTDLFLAEGRVIAVEGRAKFNQAQRDQNYARYFGLTFWSPNINIFRDPRWGRGQETLGEDPYLTGTLAVPFIRGLQGDHPRYFATIATPKHYAVHSGPEPLRHGFNVDPSRRDLWETYLPAFRQTIVEGQAWSLMCAYNAVDGKPACASHDLIQTVLRGDWNFKGFVTSDCGGIIDITTGHKYTKTNVEGAALSIRAGTDTGCNFQNEYLDLPKAVELGYLSEAEIDIALKRLFTARMRLGLFDPPEMVPFNAVPITANHSADHQAVALRAARNSIVLLKNDGALPLAAGKRVAVIGPSATSLIGLEGNYAGTPVGYTLPLDGIAREFGADNVTYAQGSPFVAELAVPIPRTAFGSGLKLEFFNGTEFKGPVIATRTAREIENNWNAVSPAPGVDANEFSARWTGTITPPAPGEYEFRLDVRASRNSDDRFVLKIEGAGEARSGAVGRAAGGQDTGESARTFKVRFDDVRPRSFSLEYSHKSPRYGPHFSIQWKAPLQALRDEALRTAANADVIVVMAGLTAWLEGEEMSLKVPGFDGGDRTDIALPKPQADLFAALQATGKPVIIVLQSGSAIALGPLGDKAAGVIQAWYGGEAGGQAIAEILSGRVNPSGRLPVTFYRSAADLPPFGDYAMAGRTYRYFPGAVEYAFGHGLSYTRFAYSGLKLGQTRVAPDKSFDVQVRVRNGGKRAGDEVAQLYLATDRPGAPIRSLKGFQRVHLKPGEARTLTFRLNPRDLALADDAGVMRILPGRYRLWVGGGQPDTGAPGVAGAFETTGALALPR